MLNVNESVCDAPSGIPYGKVCIHIQKVAEGRGFEPRREHDTVSEFGPRRET